MPRKKRWNWDEAVEGMRVVVVNLQNSETNNGIVSDVERSDKCREIDGRPIKSSKVVNVTISRDDGLEIIVERDNNNSKYQIAL